MKRGHARARRWLAPVVVVSAHSADFVWRAAGAIALAAEAGADVHVIALSYGERGESGELWKEEGQTEERVKEIRHGEAQAAADALGASFRSLDLGDYPLVMDAPAVEQLTDLLRELAPRLVLTHAALDPFNPDHGVAHDATVRARQLASGAGVASGFVTITPPELLSLRAAPAGALRVRPDDVPRHHAGLGEEGRGDGGDGRPVLPAAVLLRAGRASGEPRTAHLGPERHPLRRGVPAGAAGRGGRAVTDYAALAALGVATVHEAAGRTGIVDLPLTRVVPGSRVAGPARTALCAPGDNTMVHALVAHARPGDVLVLTSAEPAPVALVGELLATQAQAQGVAGMLVDGAVRDLDELAELGLPIWTRFVRAQGATKGEVGKLDVPVVVGGVEIRPGDLVVMDCDGAVVLPADRVDEVLPAALERAERETAVRQRYRDGELSYDLQGLRALVEG